MGGAGLDTGFHKLLGLSNGNASITARRNAYFESQAIIKMTLYAYYFDVRLGSNKLARGGRVSNYL